MKGLGNIMKQAQQMQANLEKHKKNLLILKLLVNQGQAWLRSS